MLIHVAMVIIILLCVILILCYVHCTALAVLIKNNTYILVFGIYQKQKLHWMSVEWSSMSNAA